MYTLLRQHQLHWLRHVHCMEDGQIPKDVLYRELTSGQRSTGHLQLRYKGACKRDMKALNININFLGGPHCQPHQLEKHTSQTAAVQ